MKAKFGLLSRLPLALIGLLSIVISIGCKRNAPINEAEYLGHDAPKSHMGNTTSSQRPNGSLMSSKEGISLLGYFRNYYYKFLESTDQKYLTGFLQEIGRAKLSAQLLGQSEGRQKEELRLCLAIRPNGSQSYSWTQDSSNSPSANRLSIVCTRHQQDGSWQVGNLGDIEHLPIPTKGASGGVETLPFALTAFLLYMPGKQYLKVLGFKKLKQQWFYYNLNSTGTSELFEVPNQEALRLASELGTLFFYDLMANPR